MILQRKNIDKLWILFDYKTIMKWHIFFILWVSWAWKWTLIENIKQKNLENLHIPLSYKSRAIRNTETNHVDAHFISKEEFFHWIENHEFLEYAIVHETDYYGTKYGDVIENGIDLWKIVIKELDINWLKRLRKEKPNFDANYTTIFLDIPVDILKERIEKRWALMSDEELNRRINSAVIEEEEWKKICDYTIDATLNPDEVCERFLDIVNKTK